MTNIYDIMFGPDSMSTYTIDPINVYCVKTDHIVYFTDTSQGQLQMMMFDSDEVTKYHSVITQAIYNSKTITIYYHNLTIYCVSIEQYVYPSNHASPTSFGWIYTE